MKRNDLYYAKIYTTDIQRKKSTFLCDLKYI
jgi:hypothetical protein